MSAEGDALNVLFEMLMVVVVVGEKVQSYVGEDVDAVGDVDLVEVDVVANLMCDLDEKFLVEVAVKHVSLCVEFPYVFLNPPFSENRFPVRLY